MSYKLMCAINEKHYDNGNTQRDECIKIQFNDLLVALHDAINRPKGTVPNSADRYYCQEYYNNKNDRI